MLSCSPLIPLPSAVFPYLSVFHSISLSQKESNFKWTFYRFLDVSVEVNEN